MDTPATPAPLPALQLADALGHESTDKRLDILRRISTLGSISEAARAAGVSYKAAWQALDTLSNLAGTQLVERVVGGSGGGGARVTPAGHQLLQAAGLLLQARQQVLTALASAGSGAAATPTVAALGLRTSMRNQLPCTVRALQPGPRGVRVEMALADGSALWSRITAESAELLALAPGLPVLALCKATAVTIRPHAPAGASAAGTAPDGSNRLAGQIRRSSPAPHPAQDNEATLLLPAGLHLSGYTPPGPPLPPGSPAIAHIDEAAVVIATAG